MAVTKYVTAHTFADIVRRHYSRLVVPDSKRTPATYWARLGAALKRAQLSEEEVELLARWVDKQTWFKKPVDVQTLAAKAGEWLAKAQAEQPKKANPRVEEETWDPTEFED